MLQAPTSLRETFKLLACLDVAVPLDRLLEGMDWQSVTPQQVAYATLGRLPDEIHYAGLARVDFDPKAYFLALLLGAEFQAGIVTNLLGAFPEKPRRFFVHVPRCGGTSLGETLAVQACTVPHNSLGPEWCRGREFLDQVAGICRAIPEHDALHVSGHYTLRSLVDSRLIRFGDSVWASIRKPQELTLSYVNYILTVLDGDPDLVRPDSRRWARLLAVNAPLSRLSDTSRRRLLQRLLGDGRLVPRDPLCHFLGDGTAESAFDLLAATDVELIDCSHLDQWRQQRWSVSPPPWKNASKPFIRWNDLDHAQRSLVESVAREDIALYRTVAAANGNAISVNGLQVVRNIDKPLPSAPSSGRPRRVKRADRPILLTAHFFRQPSRRAGWADPPLDYRTIETSLRLPVVDARIRVRYVRRRRDRAGLRIANAVPALWRTVSGLFARRRRP